MLVLEKKIYRDRSGLTAQVKTAGLKLTFHELETPVWFWTTINNTDGYAEFHEKLARLIYDDPKKFIGLDRVDVVSWKNVTNSYKNPDLVLYIKRSGLKKNYFTFTITNDPHRSLFSMEIRREELINLMDSATALLTD